MKGLIIKSPWIDLICEGKKIWEIRGSNTKIRGKVALIISGTGLVVGTANLSDCKPLTLNEYQSSIDKHCIPSEMCQNKPYKNIHAWVLKEAKFLDKPIPYVHPQGAVIWVNLSNEIIHLG